MRHQTSTPARIASAHSNHHSRGTVIVPVYAPKNQNRVTNTATSATSNATNRRNRGMVSANHGRSHSEYCGEYTLFVSRKQISNGTPHAHRGNDGSRRPFR